MPVEFSHIDRAAQHHIRDRHRAFALAMDLHQARAERGARGVEIGPTHRRATVDDGGQAVGRRLARCGVRCETVDGGRRGKQRCVAPMRGRRKDLGFVECR
jgi:hypothetical protein